MRHIAAVFLTLSIALLALPYGMSSAWAVDGSALAELLVRKGIITQADLAEIESELAEEQRVRDKRVTSIAQEASEKRATSVAQEVSDKRVTSIAQEAAVVPEWVQKMKWSGDIRLRNEFRDRTGSSDVNRQRVRFRLGVESQVTDELKMGARFVTGSSDDPTSTNQTLDESFERRNFSVDRAYLEYAPDVATVDTLKIKGGIMGNPFWTVSPLVWDSDLSWTGAVINLAHKFDSIDTFMNVGAFPLDDASGTDNPSLWSIQAGAAVKPFDGADSDFLRHLKIKGAVAYHDYKNAVGNSLTDRKSTNSATVEDFNEVNPSVEVSTKAGAFPVKAYADFIKNTSAGSNDDGYLVGIKIGKAKEPWSLTKGWEAGYFYERLETDALFDSFPDGDFGGGGTNHKGHVLYGKLATLKNSTFGVKYFDTEEVTGSKNHFNTLQFDWVTKF